MSHRPEYFTFHVRMIFTSQFADSEFPGRAGSFGSAGNCVTALVAVESN